MLHRTLQQFCNTTRSSSAALHLRHFPRAQPFYASFATTAASSSTVAASQSSSSSSSPSPPSSNIGSSQPKPLPQLSPKLSALDASLPDITSYPSDATPAEIAALLIEEEEKERAKQKQQWSSLALTHGICWSVVIAAMWYTEFDFSVGPFDAPKRLEEQAREKAHAELTSEDPTLASPQQQQQKQPSWLRQIRKRFFPPSLTPQQKQDAWLAQLTKQNEFDIQVAKNQQEKYGKIHPSILANIDQDSKAPGVYVGQAAVQQADQALVRAKEQSAKQREANKVVFIQTNSQ